MIIKVQLLLFITVIILNFTIDRVIGQQEVKIRKCLTPPNTAKKVERAIKECSDEVKSNIIKEAFKIIHLEWPPNHDNHDNHDTHDYQEALSYNDHHNILDHVKTKDHPENHHVYYEITAHKNDNDHTNLHQNTIKSPIKPIEHTEEHIIHVYNDHNDANNKYEYKYIGNHDESNEENQNVQEEQQHQHQQQPQSALSVAEIEDHHNGNNDDHSHQTLLHQIDQIDHEQQSQSQPLHSSHQQQSAKYYQYEQFDPNVQRKRRDDMVDVHSTIVNDHDKRIAGCLMHCIYSKNKAVDKRGWPTLDGLVNFYSDGVHEHGYFMATLRAVDTCLKGSSAKYHVNRYKAPEKGQSCDLSFDVFDCVSDKITEYCSEYHFHQHH